MSNQAKKYFIGWWLEKRRFVLRCAKRIGVALISLLAVACVNVNKDELEIASPVVLKADVPCGSNETPVRAFGTEEGEKNRNPDCGIQPAGGALNGERYRILVTTDLPADTDDIQSLIHLFLVSDLFDIEGIVSAPPTFNRTRQYIQEQCNLSTKVGCIQEVIDQYELDYPKLRSWSSNYPTPTHLRSLVKQGHETHWTSLGEKPELTEGAQWIVQQAKSEDDRPLHILVWGAITNTAIALLHHPEIADRIRILMVGWSNVNKDQKAYDYVRDQFPNVFFVEHEGAMFGVRYPERSDGYNNYTLCNIIEQKGAMGKYWCSKRRGYVDQDFVSVYYLLAGEPENPASDHWGGQYEKTTGNRWQDISDPESRMTIPETGTFNGVKTSSKWRKPRMDHLMSLFDRTDQFGEGQQRGFYEVLLRGSSSTDPEAEAFFLTVDWTLPDGSKISSDGFYDGSNLYRARAYTNQTGQWRWQTQSSDQLLNGQQGEFFVSEADLPGKLRKHQQDDYQFQYDRGDWFLHLGDTAYRYVNADEADWKRYLDQADKAGFTKIRTWFNGGRHDVQSLFNASRTGMNMPYWQEIDKRLRYAQAYYPHIQFQLIPYGEDSEEIRKYNSDPLTRRIAKVAQARFSALPNVQWCIVNDREILESGTPTKERQVLAASIEEIGRDMAEREVWGSLITSHQARWEGYSFVDSEWSDIITLEDLDQIGGELIRRYREQSSGDPVVLEEDRYELYRGPDHPAYFFRRLFWSSLLAGGHATYGGLASYEAKDGTDDTKGIIGYFDSQKTSFPLKGANQLRFISKFFENTELTMTGYFPAQNMVSSSSEAISAATNGQSVILYVPNANSKEPELAAPRKRIYQFRLRWPGTTGSASLSWYNPRSGQWRQRPVIIRPGLNWLETPAGGDWVGLVQ